VHERVTLFFIIEIFRGAIRLGMTAQLVADHHVILEWLTIVKFSIIFFYKFSLSIRELFCAER